MKSNAYKEYISKSVDFLLQNAIKKVGENIIHTTKIRNNYGAIQSFKFPILR